MKNSQIQTTSIAELEAAKNSSVFVMNMSNPAGKVVITVESGRGTPVSVVMPVTWIPIDLTSQATKKSILESPIFRRMVQNGLLTPVRAEYAEKIMSTEKAKEEYNRLYKDSMNDSAEGMGGNIDVIQNLAEAASAEASGQIGGFAQNLANTTEGDEPELVSSLLARQHSLSLVELRYIAQQSSLPQVKSAAAEIHLNRSQGVDEK